MTAQLSNKRLLISEGLVTLVNIAGPIPGPQGVTEISVLCVADGILGHLLRKECRVFGIL